LRYLLDVNVWIALLDEAHVHHLTALAFFEQNNLKIATCPLVENGVIRVLNLPGYSKFGPIGFEVVSRKLQQICADMDHMFWPDSLSLRTDGLIDWSRVLGHNQITDIYLLALAKTHQGCLATLDHRVATCTVIGATAKNLRLL
jgi:toxin-antitoxin system PIN domain toxin